ncbi:MAG: transketolase C-terminal domain-containing protein, partial [Metallosphaera sp.]
STIEYFARKTGRIVTIEEHSVIGGVGSAVAEVVVKTYPVPMRFVGATTYGRSARSQRELLDYYGLTSRNVINSALELIK